MPGRIEGATMEYMIRFTHVHETFRLAEIKALAILEDIHLEILSYSPSSPFCIVKLVSEDAARRLVRRSILVKAIYEVWGVGSNYDELHDNIKSHSQHLWSLYQTCTFRFGMDSFQGSRSMAAQRQIIETFSYLGFEGPIRMKSPEQEFCVCEEWQFRATDLGIWQPQSIYLGRYVGGSERDIVAKYDLKKRKYISTTSMDSELALITANISLAAPGKLFYDPFVGTGSFPVACAHFGAMGWGSDIDGRSIRGKGKTGLFSNFEQYGIKSCFGDSFVADLTHTPVRASRLFDGIICDPPYGVREGLKVLGHKDPINHGRKHMLHGLPSHTLPDYIPPKKPYSFLAILDDILDFSVLSLVDNGRLSFWMPTSNEVDEEIATPTHPCLKITSVCTQTFNKWSRKLITYQRLPDSEVDASQVRTKREQAVGSSADELNPFRKQYFAGFVRDTSPNARGHRQNTQQS